MLDDLWELIISNVYTTSSTRDWHPVLCKVCNDHGKKGFRAGFKKEKSTIGYNCFNCPAKFRVTEGEGITNNALRILTEFGIDRSELDKIRFEYRVNKLDEHNSTNGDEVVEKDDVPTISPLKMPFYFTYLNKLSEGDVFHVVAKEHLGTERRMATNDYPFLICTDEVLISSGMLTKFPSLERWIGRLIIPIFYRGQICHYLGYDLSGSRRQKYLNSTNDNSGIMYGMERLDTREETPLFVVEGFFDAFHINGVALFSNTISEDQLYFLRKTKRRIVIVPDRGDRKSRMGEQALAEGWEISIPDFGSAKDVGESVKRFGKPYTLKAIYDGIQKNNAVARLTLEIYKGR